MNVRSPVPVSSWPAEFRSTLALSWPLILGQVSQRLILIVNVVMMGHLGTRELAAGTLALAVVNPLMLCFGGVLTAVAPLTAQAIGSGDTSGGRVYFQPGFGSAPFSRRFRCRCFTMPALRWLSFGRTQASCPSPASSRRPCA